MLAVMLGKNTPQTTCSVSKRGVVDLGFSGRILKPGVYPSFPLVPIDCSNKATHNHEPYVKKAKPSGKQKDLKH